MARVYADLINKGVKTIDDVPEKIRAEVQMVLDSEEIYYPTHEQLITAGYEFEEIAEVIPEEAIDGDTESNTES